MLIVSHDMAFSRNICNRVVFLDEKHVYEEGTPEQIFDRPTLPRTKAFINQVQAKAIDITSKKNDVAELLSSVDGFCAENHIGMAVCNRLKDVFLTLGLQIILPRLDEESKLRVVLVDSEKKGTATIAFFYTGEHFNPETTEKKDLWEETLASVDSFEYHEYNEYGYTNWALGIINKTPE